MFLANFAPKSDLSALITCIIIGVAFVVLNIVLFRDNIFRRKKQPPADGLTEENSGQ